MLLIKSIFWYIHMVITFILIFPRILTLKSKTSNFTKKEYYEYTYGVAYRFAYSNIKLTGSKIHVIGTENIPKDRACLFVSNHQSHIDIGIFLGYIDTVKGFVSKAELSKLPIGNRWMKEIGCVFLDRADIKKSAKAINEAMQNLQNGHSMIIFPEGTRSKSSEMAEFKAGSFKLATKPKVPIVPVTIDGSYKILEDNKFPLIKAHDVYVTVHPPIFTENLSKEETAELPGKVQKIVASAIKH